MTTTNIEDIAEQLEALDIHDEAEIEALKAKHCMSKQELLKKTHYNTNTNTSTAVITAKKPLK